MAKGKKETIYSFVLNLLSKGLTYLLLLVFANYFTKEAFGKASFLLSAYGITFSFALLGVSTIFIVWFIKNKDCSSIFYLMAGLSLAALLAWGGICIYYPWILPFVLAMPLVFLFNISLSLLRAKHEYHLAQLGNVSFIVITLIAALGLSSFGKQGIIIAYSLGYAVTALWLLIPTRKELWQIARKVRLRIKPVKEYFIAALVTSLISLSFSFLGWLDAIILGWLSTYENVAVYSIVGPVSNVLTLIPLSLGAFLLTRISELKSKHISKRVLLRALRVSYAASLLMGIALISLLTPLFKLFFPNYVGNEIYAMILSIGILLYGIYVLVYTYTMGELNQNKALLPISLAAAVNVVLDILLIPRFGLYGIAFATTIAHFVAFMLLAYRVKVEGINRMLLLLPLIPLAFFMRYWGLLLLPIAILLMAKADIIRMGDMHSVLNPLKEILSSFRKK